MSARHIAGRQRWSVWQPVAALEDEGRATEGLLYCAYLDYGDQIFLGHSGTAQYSQSKSHAISSWLIGKSTVGLHTQCLN